MDVLWDMQSGERKKTKKKVEGSLVLFSLGF